MLNRKTNIYYLFFIFFGGVKYVTGKTSSTYGTGLSAEVQ